jgi:GntR family transcriptional regulator
MVPGLRLTDGMSLYEVLQRQYHLYPARARESYVAALAGDDTAGLLNIAAGAPVFAVERVTFTLNETPFEFVQSTVRGDRYAIVLDLVKNAGEQQALTLNR